MPKIPQKLVFLKQGNGDCRTNIAFMNAYIWRNEQTIHKKLANFYVLEYAC